MKGDKQKIIDSLNEEANSLFKDQREYDLVKHQAVSHDMKKSGAHPDIPITTLLNIAKNLEEQANIHHRRLKALVHQISALEQEEAIEKESSEDVQKEIKIKLWDEETGESFILTQTKEGWLCEEKLVVHLLVTDLFTAKF